MNLKVTTSDGNHYNVKEHYDEFSHTMAMAKPGQLLQFRLTDNRVVAVAAHQIVSVEDMNGSSEREEHK